jgi:hypothetical protein
LKSYLEGIRIKLHAVLETQLVLTFGGLLRLGKIFRTLVEMHRFPFVLHAVILESQGQFLAVSIQSAEKLGVHLPESVRRQKLLKDLVGTLLRPEATTAGATTRR